MYRDIEERVQELARYVIETGATVRTVGKKFGLSKSTAHKDLSERIEKTNPSLARQVREILDTNKSERYIRGGNATKQKYMCKKVPHEELVG